MVSPVGSELAAGVIRTRIARPTPSLRRAPSLPSPRRSGHGVAIAALMPALRHSVTVRVSFLSAGDCGLRRRSRRTLRQPSLAHHPADVVRVFGQQFGDGGALMLAERQDQRAGTGHAGTLSGSRTKRSMTAGILDR
jgi:hypothetical protein